MAADTQRRTLLFTVFLALAVLGAGLAFAGSTAAQTADITVATDASGDFTSIQAAVDNATANDTIAVEAGTYNESVVVDKNVTLVANGSVTLVNGSATNATAGVTIGTDAAPVINGFSFTGWETAINAFRTDGDWVVANASSSPSGQFGINADESTGNWTVVESEITNATDDGIAASETNGSWVVSNTTIRNGSGRGIDAAVSTGNWTVQNTQIEHTDQYGITAGQSEGDWLVYNVTVRDTGFGVDAPASTGDWTVANSSISSVTGGVTSVETSGSWTLVGSQLTDTTIGVFANESVGDWTVAETTIDNSSFAGVFAQNASGNWEVFGSRITRSGGTTTDVVTGQTAAISAVGTEAEWTVTETAFINSTGEAINATGAVFQGEAAYNYWNASDGPSGVYSGSGDAGVGNLAVRPFYADAALTDLVAPEFNATASSVTPTTTSTNETRTYTIDVTFDNSTLTDESGEVDVSFESFELETGDDLTINFTDANITSGTLSVSTAINATAPTAAGVYDVAVTDLRTDSPDEQLIDDAYLEVGAVEVTDAAGNESVGIQYDPANPSAFGNEELGRTAELLRIAVENRTSFELGGSATRSFRIVNPDTGENVSVSPEFGGERYNVTELEFYIYSPGGGEITPKLGFEADNTFIEANATVTGDLAMFENASPFASYRVELVSDTDETVLDATEPAIHGIGYNGTLVQNSTTETIEVTLNRSAAVNESWAVAYTVHNETGRVRSQPVNNSAANANFTATINASTLENGTYDHEFVISPTADAESGDRIIGIKSFDPLTIGAVSESSPEVNTSASSVTPTTATTGEYKQYTVDVTIDNTTLADESGEVDVTFGGFDLETGDDLTINYTQADLANGTLSVSSTVNATAPNEAGTYGVGVTALRTDTDEVLIDDAFAQIGIIEVTEPTDTVTLEYDPSSAGASSSGIGAGKQTREELHVATVTETSFEFGSSVNRSFRIVNPDNDQSVTVSPESGVGMYNVTAVGLDINEGTGEIRTQPELELDLPSGSARINATVTGDRGMFQDDTPFAPYAVELVENGTALAATETAIHGVGYTGSLTQNATSGTIAVTLNRSQEVNESWTVEYSVRNDSAGTVLTTPVANNDSDAEFTATFDAEQLAAGNYTHALDIYPADETGVGDRILSVFGVETLAIETDGSEVGTGAAPELNGTATSITPTSVRANETEAYDLTVTIDNTSLTDESGELDIDVADFELESQEPDLTINYSAANITNGTLSVSTSVTATAPTTTGVRDINLTDLRVDDPDGALLDDANRTLGTIEVLEDTNDGGSVEAEPDVNETVSTVTPQTALANQSQEYDVNVTIDNTTLTDESGEVDVAFEAFDLDLPDEDSTDDTEHEDLTITYTGADLTNGTLSVSASVNATAPGEPGRYNVSVTDLRIEGADDPDASLIEDADTAIGTIDVEPSQPNASDDRITLSAGETFGLLPPGILENDNDPNNDSLSAETVVAPTNGTLSLDSEGGLQYTPDDGFTGIDEATYEVTDPAGNTDTATITFDVTNAIPESLDVSVADSAIPNGTNTSLTATATLTNGSTVDVTENATLTSGDESVVTVDNATGTVTALAEGSTTLNASYGPFDASTTITVDPAAVAGLNASLADDRIDSDEETSLTARAVLTNGSTRDVTTDAAITADDDSLVSVDSTTGTITGNAAGTVTLTADFQGQTDSVLLTLEVPPLTVDRTSVAFGNVSVANESVQEVTITNNASTDISIETAALNGSGADQFAVPNATGEVQADSTRTINVSFVPTTDGPATALLNLTASQPERSPQSISLTGTGTVTNLSLTANESSILAGEPVAFTVTDDEGSPVNATIELPTTEAQTGPDGNATVRIETLGSLEATASKEPTAVYVADSVSIIVGEPTLTVDEPTIGFGSVSLGSTAHAQVTLVNNASTDVEVDAAAISGSDPSAFALGDVPAEVAATTNRTVNVSFTPTNRGEASATLELGDDTVGLTGTAVAPQVNVSSVLPVATTAEQGGSDTATVRVTNDGTAALNATVAVDSDRFSADSTVDIAAGESGSVTVEFSPEASDTGSIGTDLTITPDTTAVPAVSVPVSGTVLERSVDLRRSEVAFGNVTVGETVESAVVVDNTGTTTENLTVSTTNETRFALAEASDGTITLAPGDSERLAIEATLNSSVAVTETLTVQNDSYTSVNSTATLTATGRAPNLTVAATEPVGFDDTPVNSTSTETIRIDNDGEATLTVSLAEAFNTTEAANFSIVGATNVEIPADGSRNVTVGFSPQTAGNATANLTLVTNDIAATAAERNVSLEASGFETDLQIGEEVPDFGAVGVGGSATANLTIVNNGSSDLGLSETVSSTEFAVDSLPNTLEGNSNTTVGVTFTPAADGSRTGTLSITGTDDNTDEETTISTSLVGTGRYGELGVAQGTLRTGVTATDSTTTGSVTVENIGLNDTTVTIDEIAIVDTANFSVGNGLSAGDTLGGEAASLAVTFDPAADAENGEQQTTLTLDASSGERTFTRNLTVVGVVSAPEPTVSTDELAVGTVTAGEQTLRTVTVSNDGGERFDITDVSADAAGVVADRIGSETVVPSGESTVVVAINRSTTGPFTSDVTVETTDEDLTVTVTGDTAAPDLNVTAETVDFGETPVGSASQREITLRNDGNASLTVARPTITGDGSFGILSGDRRLRIAAGGSQNVSLGFGPNATGTASGTLVIEPLGDPTDDEGQRTITLTGTGTEADARLDTSALSFGDVSQGDNRSRTLNITNNGTAELTVTGASLIGSDAGAFNVSGLATGGLAPGASEAFTVTVDTAGSARGGLSSQLVINTDDADVTSQLGATVVAPDIEVGSAISADRFGTTRLGTSSTATLAVNNTGNAELDLTDLSVAGADGAAFSVVEAPETVDEQATGRVVVEFDPAALSESATRAQNTPLSATATLNISSDDPDSSEQYRTVRLGGEAVTAAFETPRTFQFGDVGIGSTASSQLTVENTLSATAPLNITAVEVSGADAGDYTVALNGSDTPATLAPGETATVDVSLRPTSPGQKFATLSVYTNDSRQPVLKTGLSNTETVYRVDYGSVHVSYINPTEGVEPTVNVDEGLRGRNASLRTVSSNVSTTADYTLDYTFGATETAVDHDTALKTDGSGNNVTALRYMNATTSADVGNFSDSTFRMEVSKAALAAQEVTPENVTIYHETDSGYESLDTELLFETTGGYVYETTADSYSVFAVGVPDRRTVESISIELDETTLNESESTTATVTATYDDGSEVDVTSSADITSGDTGVASASGATVRADSPGTASIEAAFDGLTASVDLTVESDGGDGGPTNTPTTSPSTDPGDDTDSESPAEPTADTTIAEIVEQVSQSEPATDVEAEITDSDPETPGVTVEAEGSQSVGRITFADETVTGSVSVREYQPSAELTSQIEQTMTADLAGDSSDGSSDGEATVRLRSLTDISPDSSAATESAATVELSVDRDELDDPANAFVVHETDDGWERLETTVQERDGGTVTLTAETDSFSLFAVAETQQTQQTQPSDGSEADGETTTADEVETTDETGDTGGSSVLPIIGVLVIVAAVAAVLWIRREE